MTAPRVLGLMSGTSADGIDAACLGVDAENPRGALSLYERLGYRPTASTCVHELVEAPGASVCPVRPRGD